MPSILVDTGPLVALASRRDRWHTRCVKFLSGFRGDLITTWPVLTGFSHLLDSPAALQQLHGWAERGGLRIHSMGHDDLKTVADWMSRYADRPMDLADASLVHVARATGIQHVWTIDRSILKPIVCPIASDSGWSVLNWEALNKDSPFELSPSSLRARISTSSMRTDLISVSMEV